MDSDTLAAMIDQTLLAPTAGYATVAGWLERSRGVGFAAVCVAPYVVPLAVQQMAGTPTKVCSVVGFPLGYCLTENKVEEARRLAGLGAVELDMVVNIGALLEGDEHFVSEDIGSVVVAVRDVLGSTGLVKAIIETGYLSSEQIAVASRLAVEAGAAYVKTSTGFGPRGATVDDVRIMRDAIGDEAGIKAAGGIRDLATAQALIDAGADRIGASSGLEILAELVSSTEAAASPGV